MKVISQRELRNDNAAVMRAVEDGESYTVTRRGVPVARLAPWSGDADLRCLRPASTRPIYSEIDRIVAPTTSVAEVLADLRGER